MRVNRDIAQRDGGFKDFESDYKILAISPYGSKSQDAKQFGGNWFASFLPALWQMHSSGPIAHDWDHFALTLKLSPMRYLYLHGFASSPFSRKARLFKERLLECGIQAEVLDLAPDFQSLTITGQLKVVADAARGERVVLIGSSLGGYLAALYATRHPEVDRLVLLAPAFNFYQLWTRELGAAKLQEWRENGTICVYHYGRGQEARLGFEFMLDAEQYPGLPNFEQPCLLIHGQKDAVVPFEQSSNYAASHPDRIKFISYESGHELTDVLNEIWNASSSFLLNANT